MEVFIIVLFILVGLFFFIVEVFFIFGISIVGIVLVICLLYVNYYVFDILGLIVGFIILIVFVLSCIVIIVWFMYLKIMDKFFLKKILDYKIDFLKGIYICIGDKGIVIICFVLIGNVNFNGYIIEVCFVDGLIDENIFIYVERMVEGMVIVCKFN